MINDALVVTGEDDRIYAGAPGEALEVAHEPNAKGVSLAAGNDRVVAWGTSLAESGGTWLGITTDGQTWSEHLTDLSLAVVEPLSDELGAGYLGITPGSVSNPATVYRSQDLDTWTEVARINGDAIGCQVVETDRGILAFARGSINRPCGSWSSRTNQATRAMARRSQVRITEPTRSRKWRVGCRFDIRIALDVPVSCAVPIEVLRCQRCRPYTGMRGWADARCRSEMVGGPLVGLWRSGVGLRGAPCWTAVG